MMVSVSSVAPLMCLVLSSSLAAVEQIEPAYKSPLMTVHFAVRWLAIWLAGWLADCLADLLTVSSTCL